MATIVQLPSYSAADFSDKHNREFSITRPNGCEFVSISVRCAFPSFGIDVPHIYLAELIQLRDALTAHIEAIQSDKSCAAAATGGAA